MVFFSQLANLVQRSDPTSTIISNALAIDQYHRQFYVFCADTSRRNTRNNTQPVTRMCLLLEQQVVGAGQVY